VKGPFINLPNSISISRIPLSAAAGAFLLSGRSAAALACAAAAVLTDWLDGWSARVTRSESDWGRVLDPLADKLGFAFFGICLVIEGRIPLWTLLFTAGRDAAVGAGALLLARRLSSPPPSTPAGKVSTVLLSGWMLRQTVSPAVPTIAGLDWLGLLAMASLAFSTAVYARSALAGTGRAG
jgi:cardiolipin synthase (CMP-forming)